MERQELIYLDNAATSFPKPPKVIEDMQEHMLYWGGNAGRGSHALSLRAAERIYDCREKLAKLFDADSAEQVCFTMNTTQALNLCIKGLLGRGDHVLISDIEHNAVYRPIYKLKAQRIIDYDVFPSMMGDKRRSAERICAAIGRLVRRETRMLICSGTSNICSMNMPLAEIGAFCRRLGILFVVDGAQCAGHTKISMKDMKIDALCLPGHKGLLGPQGCGALILGKGVRPATLIEGGNGVASLEGEMSEDAPERYEAGTLPAPAIVGLSAGIDVLCELGISRIEEHERRLFKRARDKLGSISGVRVYCPEYEGSVLSFNIEGLGSEEVARALSEQGICVRGGYHCSALGHRTMGTVDTGSVRASFGVCNSSRDIDSLCDAVIRIKKAK